MILAGTLCLFSASPIPPSPLTTILDLMSRAYRSVRSRHSVSAAQARPQPLDTPDLFAPQEAATPVPDLPVLGIDVAKATFRACLLRGGSSRTAEADFANSPEGFAQLDRWLEELGAARSRAALEATGPYSLELLRHLHDAGHHVSLLNPRWVKDFARSEGRRNKTDAADARVIARYLHTHAARPWQPRSPHQEELQALSRRRDDVQRLLVAEKLRLQSAGVHTASLIKATIAHCERQFQQIDKAVRQVLAADQSLRQRFEWLQSIPGIGPRTALALLAELPALDCFQRVRDVAAWAGLTPALCESGTSVHKRSRLNKQGNRRLRKALYMPALVLLRTKTRHSLSHLRDRLRAAGKAEMVIVGALMRKLFQVACGVLKHQQPFNNSLA